MINLRKIWGRGEEVGKKVRNNLRKIRGGESGPVFLDHKYKKLKVFPDGPLLKQKILASEDSRRPLTEILLELETAGR